MKRHVEIAGWVLALLALGGFELAIRNPELTERWYAQSLYPHVVGLFSHVSGTSISLAELILVAALVAIPWTVYRWLRGRSFREGAGLLAAVLGWMGALLVWTFLALWGFNYARPSLAERLALSESEVAAADVLEAGRRMAERTGALYDELEVDAAPTELPFTFAGLDDIVDGLYRELDLPGDAIASRAAPAKALASSTVFSYLGISGIFVPFTGEPSVNALQPDVSFPVVLAHEKAHQRGITDEGEANFAAFLACSHESAPAYLRYAAYLFATRHLLGEASRYAPEEDVREAWALLGEGPLADLEAIRLFWQQYQGRAMEAAARVNDRYLRTMRVEGGVESYGTVVRLLMALDARGEL